MNAGLFAKDQVQMTAQWRFMTEFMREISQPILLGDEHLDYLPTQAIAEYLLHHHAAVGGVSGRIEAIIYGSAQRADGTNIAVLGNAASTGVPEQDEMDPFIRLPFGRKKFRLTPKAGSLECRIITGATYALSPRFRIGKEA